MSGAPANEGATLAPVNRGLRSDEAVAAAIGPWLRHHLPGGDRLRIDALARPAGSGVANETILVDLIHEDTGAHEGVVVRLDSPDYWYLERELRLHYRMYQAFDGNGFVPTPHVYGFEDDAALLGEKFFVMERRPGTAIPDVPNYNTAGWLFEATPARRQKVWRSSVETLAQFHRAADTLGVGPFGFLARPERGRTGLEQGLHYWRAYYDWAVEGAHHPVMEASWRWLVEHRPDAPVTGLAWGDARIGNFLYVNDAVTALLDWDLVSLSGAESDLAWWLLMDLSGSTGAGVARLDGLGTPQDTIALWERALGRPAQHLEYHLAFAAFRLGAVLIKLANFLAQRGLSSPERDRMKTDNYGTQILATKLGLPTPAPPVITWHQLVP